MPAPTSPVGEYVLYADKRKMAGNLNKRMLFICVPLILFIFVLFGSLNRVFATLPSSPPPRSLPGSVPARPFSPFSAVFGWLPWFLVAECLLLWWVSSRAHRKQVNPIVTLGPQGMSIDTMATHVGLLAWDEIGEVRAYNLGYRYVGVVPRDAKALYRRLGLGRSWLLWLNTACIPMYRLFGVFIAPINIPQVYLPIPADELLATIHAYQNAFGRRTAVAVVPPGTWPPPPSIPD